MSSENGQNYYSRSYLDQLRRFAGDLPIIYRTRCTDDLMSQMANLLLDDTVFLIVKELREIQDMTERAQFSARQKLVDQQMVAKEELLKKHRDSIVRCQSRQQSSTLQMVLDSNEKELKKFDQQAKETLIQKDTNIIKELDQLVAQQQVMLEKAGVPGFFLTDDAEDIQLQMYLVTFITNLESSRNF